MPDPQPQAPHQPTRLLSRPRPATFIHGRLRWLHRCPWCSLGMPRCPPSPGSKGRADRPARQQGTQGGARLVGAGPTPGPEGEQSQSGRDRRGQDPKANRETGWGRGAVRSAGLTSRQPTEVRFATVGQRPRSTAQARGVLARLGPVPVTRRVVCEHQEWLRARVPAPNPAAVGPVRPARRGDDLLAGRQPLPCRPDSPGRSTRSDSCHS
jgi:hypothetical protein